MCKSQFYLSKNKCWKSYFCESPFTIKMDNNFIFFIQVLFFIITFFLHKETKKLYQLEKQFWFPC